jgi:hypothetical protein
MRNNTYYCTTDCQKTSWKNGHKGICKLLGATRTLYRAGSTLQQIFYKYREMVFDRRIVKIEEKNGKLYLHEQRPPQIDFEMLRLLDFLVPFPTHLCRTKQDRQGILPPTWLATMLLRGCMMLSRACWKVGWRSKWELSQWLAINRHSIGNHEARGIPKNSRREVIAVEGRDYETGQVICSHSIIKLALKHGRESYALDTPWPKSSYTQY